MHNVNKQCRVWFARSVKSIVRARKVPNLSHVGDVADIVTGAGTGVAKSASVGDCHVKVALFSLCVWLLHASYSFAAAAVIGDASDSEMEEEVSKIDLPDTASSRKNPGGQSAVRLCEIGPRMSLKLVKIENGMATGDVLYHAFGTFYGDNVSYRF